MIHWEIQLYKLILFNNPPEVHINLKLEINFLRRLRIGADCKLVYINGVSNFM